MDFIDARQETDTKDRENLMIVDGLNLAFRYKYANKKQYAIEYLNTIKSLGTSYDAKDIIILGDGGSDYRENIYPEYKKSRKDLKTTQTEEEKQNFIDFLEEFNKTFELLNEFFYTFRFKGVEADDIAAFITKYYKHKYKHVWLISSDKDWDLLIGRKVSRFSTVTRKETTAKNWNEHYEYNQPDHISIKVLMGDKGDDIPGVDGVGIKRASLLVKDYGTAFDVYASMPLPGKQKFIENLNKFGDKILLNYELMDLETYCEQAIGEENMQTIRNELGDV